MVASREQKSGCPTAGSFTERGRGGLTPKPSQQQRGKFSERTSDRRQKRPRTTGSYPSSTTSLASCASTSTAWLTVSTFRTRSRFRNNRSLASIGS